MVPFELLLEFMYIRHVENQERYKHIYANYGKEIHTYTFLHIYKAYIQATKHKAKNEIQSKSNQMTWFVWHLSESRLM